MALIIIKLQGESILNHAVSAPFNGFLAESLIPVSFYIYYLVRIIELHKTVNIADNNLNIQVSTKFKQADITIALQKLT